MSLNHVNISFQYAQ